MTSTLIGEMGPSLAAFAQVLMIDLVLAGDNAVAVGLAAGGLPTEQRRKVIVCGLAAAVVLRIGFALVTTWLLGVVGLLLAGGLLLLWVCWKMWRDLRAAEANEAGHVAGPAKTFGSAFLQVLVADVSMSLDNVLAVAGAAREHPGVLVAGLLLSIILMGLAANAIAALLRRYRWIGYAGLAIVLYVAGHMIWQGYRDVAVDLGWTSTYDRLTPQPLHIGASGHVGR
ncbi:TerC family protein [Caulobacter soli]|uniref:TerC family protein n=1 Tax=Caulobacter soli TaxID=2708539 RepID=UPI0013EAA279|nr:TerC family protein [Caulobacter soli]